MYKLNNKGNDIVVGSLLLTLNLIHISYLFQLLNLVLYFFAEVMAL